MVFCGSSTIVFFPEYVLDTKQRAEGRKPRTIERYEQLLERILPAIGHLKLTEIRPHHLNSLYKNLGEAGIRLDGKKLPQRQK